MNDCGFTNAGISMAFACKKADSSKPKVQSPKLPALDFRLQTLDSKLETPSATRITTVTPLDLDAAQQLADCGRLDEAAAICENHLRKEGPSARAYYLLGLVCDANGDAQASEFYRKALYLEPNHYESLLHMALLLEKNGDATGASTFKRRAERAQPKT